jgi:hypothetical protein
MKTVRGIATAQKTHWLVSMFRMSLVFMPRMAAMLLRGRKTTVTMVKA